MPVLISNPYDFADFVEQLNNSDILDIALHNRPNTEYTVETIPATSFYLYHLNEFPIGCTLTHIPDFIRHNRAINILQKDTNSKPYTDNFCFFLKMFSYTLWFTSNRS